MNAQHRMKFVKSVLESQMNKELTTSIEFGTVDSGYELFSKDRDLNLYVTKTNVHILAAVDHDLLGKHIIDLVCGKKFLKNPSAIPVFVMKNKFSINSMLQKDFAGMTSLCDECITVLLEQYKTHFAHQDYYYGGTGKSAGATSAFIECHTGTHKLWENETIVLSIGGSMRKIDLTDADLIINASGTQIVDSSNVRVQSYGCATFPAFKALERISPFHVIYIGWPDYGIPELDVVFWQDLAKAVHQFGGVVHKATGRKAKVIVMCSGGHGRSGTAASILTYMFGEFKEDEYEDVVAQIRKVYCSKAVESSEQLKYIGEITQSTIKSKAAKTAVEITNVTGPHSWAY